MSPVFWCKLWFLPEGSNRSCERTEAYDASTPSSPSPGPSGWNPNKEVNTFSPYCMDPVRRNRLSTLNLCRETSSQLIIWSRSHEKWIHFHFLGLPLKLLREDNYFPSSKYFLTSFSWK